jgi:hypothetical protein
MKALRWRRDVEPGCSLPPHGTAGPEGIRFVSKRMDSLALWQFTLFYASAMLLAVAGGGIVIDGLTGRHVDVAVITGYGALYSAVQTLVGIWSRQRRLHRLPSRERVSVPGKMRPYVGLNSGARNVVEDEKCQ